jgi:predicted transcriptional regulator
MSDAGADKDDLIAMTGAIVTRYLEGNQIPVGDVPVLIECVHSCLSALASGRELGEEGERAPAVPVKKSVTDEFIVCLEDGKKFKSLKRHLRTRYAMTPEEYRQRWNLPHDYPMVAPNYAKARSMLAKRMGLGQGRSLGRGQSRT